MKQLIYVMGVSGSGKSTIGQLLSEKLSWPFFDGDDFHPESNIRKMEEGIPLEDTDRWGWLSSIKSFAENETKYPGLIIACSALKESYRDFLSTDTSRAVKWVYLKGEYSLIEQRMEGREGHFMKSSLLKSQFETLEEPKNAIEVRIDNSTDDIIKEILNRL